MFSQLTLPGDFRVAKYDSDYALQRSGACSSSVFHQLACIFVASGLDTVLLEG